MSVRRTSAAERAGDAVARHPRDERLEGIADHDADDDRDAEVLRDPDGEQDDDRHADEGNALDVEWRGRTLIRRGRGCRSGSVRDPAPRAGRDRFAIPDLDRGDDRVRHGEGEEQAPYLTSRRRNAAVPALSVEDEHGPDRGCGALLHARAEHAAHSLKGALRTLAAPAASEAALQLEVMAREGDLSRVEQGWGVLEREMIAPEAIPRGRNSIRRTRRGCPSGGPRAAARRSSHARRPCRSSPRRRCPRPRG